MTVVRRVLPTEAVRLRAVRLRALLDAPSAFASTHAREEAAPPAFWRDRVELASAGDESAYFLAVDGELTQGMVGAFRPDGDRHDLVQLVAMWTAPEARGHGVGQQLVEAVVAWADGSGGSELFLWVTEGNVSAKRLYERCGFVDTGERAPLPSDVEKTEVRMRLA